MKKNDERLRLFADGDRDIVMVRAFAAPARLVFDAYTKPELIKRWLTGPPGWTMPVCTVDLRVGGAYRYEWLGADGYRMAAGGIYREIDAPRRFVATERFDEAWYEGEALGTFAFDEKDGRTTLTQTMTYVSREARDAVLKTPMESGVAMSFDRLAGILAEMQAR